MYKFKIINYQPYEYEIFQSALDELGKQKYLCHDLSFISVFKKVNHPVYYKIDFYKPQGRSHFEKNANKNKFYDYYLERDYQPIYHKRGMHVFVGKKELSHIDQFQDHLETLIPQKRIRTLAYAVLFLFLTLLAAMFAFESYTIDSLLTYGMTFVYIGFFIALLTLIFRQYTHYIYYTKLHKKATYSQSRLKQFRRIYVIGSFIACLMIGGGLIEDVLNTKSFSLKEHSVIQFKDLGFNQQTDFSSQKKSSFTVPHYYASLETMDDMALLTKEYQMSSIQSAQNLLKDLQNNPHQYICTSVKEKNGILYGYYQDKLNAFLFQKEKSVIIVTFSFDLSQQQIDTMIQFYQ